MMTSVYKMMDSLPLLAVGGGVAAFSWFWLYKRASVNVKAEKGQSVKGKVVSLKEAVNARARSRFDTTGVEGITESVFQQTVVEGSRKYPVLVDFYATWCGPCRALAPMLEQISQQPEFKGRIHFTKIDVDYDRALASRYHVQSMPTVVLFEFGEERMRVRGAQPAAIVEMLKRSLGL